ncbi:alpha/beta hydrolase [Paracoccus sp. (in: a-proteobacteria)]|uniref:alpha/beta hydrolase n=1 Tax=Paracoccus sp. TaxID=267 RepID=UPI0028A0F82A|nr:alpha/beta hydrolase [Paracoccus sp. (in: a-proteobacteria)]
MTEYLDTSAGRRIAYNQSEGHGTGVVFLGGFRSDMQGTKAVALEEWARSQGRPFLRFDYSGHGESSGNFEEGAIGDWFADATAAISALTQGPQVLVGSSMGGWIALLLARAMPQKIAGLVTVAAAPDFTEQGFWAGFTKVQRARLIADGKIEIPSDYDAPYAITHRLIEDGRAHLVMQQPLDLPFPVRLLQGTMDADVPMEWALDLLEHATGTDIRLTLVKGADHRFSTPDCLAQITTSVEEVLAAAG